MVTLEVLKMKNGTCLILVFFGGQKSEKLNFNENLKHNFEMKFAFF